MTAVLLSIHGIQKPQLTDIPAATSVARKCIMKIDQQKRVIIKGSYHIPEPSYDAYTDLLAFYISHPRPGQASGQRLGKLSKCV